MARTAARPQDGGEGAETPGCLPTPLLLHYDGTSWTLEDISAGGSGHAAIVASPGTSNVWAVGSVGEDTDYEHAFVARRH
ncbi:hypothetical protein [Nonomuraea sp. NPDC003201]